MEDMDNNFRTDQTVSVDIDLSPEEIARLGNTRPFWKFVTFPINVSVAKDIIINPLCNCKKPERKNPSGACGCNWCLNCDSKISCVAPPINWETFPGGIKGIGPKPESIKIEMGKKKETYISPFTGKVT